MKTFSECFGGDKIRIYDRTTGDIFTWRTATEAQLDALRKAAGGHTDEIIGVMAEERGDLWLNFISRSCRVSPALFCAAGQADTAGGDNAFAVRWTRPRPARGTEP